MAPTLSPTAQAILKALTRGPATSTDLRKAIGRNKATIDKALSDLVTNDLIVALTEGDDDSQPQYSLPTNVPTTPDADNATDPAPSADADPASDTHLAPDGATDSNRQNAHNGADTLEAGDRVEATMTETRSPGTEDLKPQPHVDAPQEADTTGPEGAPAGEASTATDSSPTARLTADAQEAATGTEGHTQDVKRCKGCQTTMPLICPCCARKTLAYCSACQTTRSATPRRGPGEREILANGLPKLRTGELAQMVHKVMTEHPVPDYKGITGWTSSRIAVFLPGRSTGAIGESLEKLANTRQAELLGESPRRYVLIQPPSEPDSPDTGTNGGNGADMTPGPEDASPDSPDSPIA
jgi:hypothetical protein